MIDYAIEVLTELLIKQDFEDKKKGKTTYVKKTQCYKDLISLLKKYKKLD
jgi:stalled ribosome alternative rescue factor ArfA